MRPSLIHIKFARNLYITFYITCNVDIIYRTCFLHILSYITVIYLLTLVLSLIGNFNAFVMWISLWQISWKIITLILYLIIHILSSFTIQKMSVSYAIQMLYQLINYKNMKYLIDKNRNGPLLIFRNVIKLFHLNILFLFKRASMRNMYIV